jgi:hypothetical protein
MDTDNVKQKGCFKASTDGTGGYNSCYNDKQLKEVNRHRLQHETTPLLTLHVDAAKWLHAELNKSTFTDFATFKGVVDADATYKVCKVINYKTTTIDAQYDAGILKYDYTTSDYSGGAAAATTPANCATTATVDCNKVIANKFLQLVWKSSTNAAFAKTAIAEVGLFCPKATTNQSDFSTNVGKSCLASGTEKFNTCFDKVQRDAANAKRADHGASALAADDGSGKVLQ